MTHRHSKPITNIRSEEEYGLTDEDRAWLDAPAVGAEIIYDRYSVPGEEISKSDFLAQPSRVLESEKPVYVVNQAGSDWLVMSADHYYDLLAELEEARRKRKS